MKSLIYLSLVVILIVGATSAFAAREVMLYTGTFQWIDKAMVDEEADICKGLLDGEGIPAEITEDENAVKSWMQSTAGDGSVDVLVIYGDIPPAVYAGGNAEPDGSVAENWIETTDGDMILNHADYMFWGVGGRNKEGGLQNMMDIPDIVMWDDDTPMQVTADGKKYTPSLVDFNSDRPFHLDQLADNWKAEVIFASNTGDDTGTRADPVVVRDGNLGRLCIVHQTASEDNPKGEVAAEIIFNYLKLGAPTTPVEPGGKASTTWANIKR